MSKKGVKLDWNALAREGGQDTALPSAPGQGLSYDDRGRGGRGGRDDRFGSDDGGWGRTSSGSNDFRRTGSSGSSYGERPKLNLQARTLPIEPGQAAPTSNGSTAGGKDDKWDNIFNKSTTKAGGGDARNLPRGDARSQPINEDEDGFQDARFASKFRSSHNKSPDGGSEVIAEAMQNAVIEEEKVKRVDPKKAAKAAARAEEEKKKQQEKEAALAAKEAMIQAEKEALEATKKISEDVISKGIKGSDLVKHIQGMETKPEPASLISLLLNKVTDPSANAGAAVKWCAKAEYGDALASLLAGNVSKQLFSLYEVQKYCNDHKFPKVDVKGEKKNLVEIIFQVMYSNEVIDNDGFSAWSEDENDEIPGKLNAVVQTTNFMTMINEIDEDDDDEEGYEDEVDAARETI